MVVKRMEIIIAGRSLRFDSFAWVEKLAQDLYLRGAVFARNDGSIKVTAEGEEFALQEFANKIERGNMFGLIENFSVKWFEPNRSMGNFHVLVGS